MMIDTHCHLNIEEFEHDYKDAIARAKDSGVKQMIVIGIDPKSNQKAIDIAEAYDFIYATVGIHPGVVDDYGLDGLKALLSHKKVVALGEIGLDFYWRDDNKDRQIEVFRKQLDMAVSLDLPVVIHTRNSFTEAYEIVKPYQGKIKGVFHCFSSNLEDAKKAVDLGFYVGIDGPVTFKNAKDIKEIAKEIALESLLIETDSPYLSPHPFRGKRNEPSRLHLIAQAIANIKEISVDDVVKQTTMNAINLFKLGDKHDENI